MSQPPEDFHPRDVVYQQVTADLATGMAKVRTIDDKKPGILLEEKLENLDEEIENLADVIGETEVGTAFYEATLTVDGYKKKDDMRFKNALIKLGSNEWIHAMEEILANEAYIFKAVYKGETVGVAIIDRLDKKFGAKPGAHTSDREKAPLTEESSGPENSLDLSLDEAALREEKIVEIMNQLRFQLNRHIDHYGASMLWEFEGFGVKEKFRRQGIGRMLAKYAFAKVPNGSAIFLQADPLKASMYQHMGFKHSTLEHGTPITIRVKPEWSPPGEFIEFPIMVLEK